MVATITKPTEGQDIFDFTKTVNYFGMKLWNTLRSHLWSCRTLETFEKNCALYFMDKVKSDEFLFYLMDGLYGCFGFFNGFVVFMDFSF